MYPEGCSYLPLFLTSSYTAPKPKGLVRQNTFEPAVAAPTDKRGLVTPEFPVLVYQPLMVLDGMGLGYPKGRPLSARTPARLYPCVSTSPPTRCV